MEEENTTQADNTLQTPEIDDRPVNEELIFKDVIDCTCSQEGTLITNETFSLSIDQLFTLCLTNSDFFVNLHSSQDNIVLSEIPWTEKPGNEKIRVVKIKWATKQAIGPSYSNVTETYTMETTSNLGQHYSISVEGVNEGIPFEDSFYIYTHYCIQKISETKTSMKIHGQVKFRKYMFGFVKGLTEKLTVVGWKNHFGHLCTLLREEERKHVPTVNGQHRKKKKRITRALSSYTEQDRPPMSSTNPEINNCSMDQTTLILFFVILLLLLLNGMLYYQLRQLENAPPISFLDMTLFLHTQEARKQFLEQDAGIKIEATCWQTILNDSFRLLRQMEDNLRALRKCFTRKKGEL